MWRKSAVTLSLLVVAFGILITSVLRTAAVKYEFTGAPDSGAVLGAESVDIKYNLAYPGKVLPDSPFWSLKALRDRVWLFVTTNPYRKSELNLLFADKARRLCAARFSPSPINRPLRLELPGPHCCKCLRLLVHAEYVVPEFAGLSRTPFFLLHLWFGQQPCLGFDAYIPF